MKKGTGCVNGIPEISWMRVDAGEFIYQNGETRELEEFQISEFMITNTQFQAFIDAEDGYDNDEWWKGMPKGEPKSGVWGGDTNPCDSVNWYEATAFCRWLSSKLGVEVSLPTEEQWEKAARGTDGRIYPWGNEWDSSKANTGSNDKYDGSSPVDAFPEGRSPYGCYDMAGNLWEWVK